MLLRNYVKTDCPQLERLFYDTVHTVNAKDYTQEQLAAWATGKVNLEAWNESLQAHHHSGAAHGGSEISTVQKRSCWLNWRFHTQMANGI